MDNSVRQQESHDQQPPIRFLAGNLHIFDGVLQRLASLIQLTEEEQEDAGIYYPGEQPGRQPDK